MVRVTLTDGHKQIRRKRCHTTNFTLTGVESNAGRRDDNTTPNRLRRRKSPIQL